MPPAAIRPPLVVPSSDSGPVCRALCYIGASSTITHSSLRTHTFADFSVSVPVSAAITHGLVFRVHNRPTVTVTSLVFPVSPPCSAAFSMVHDSEDDDHNTSPDGMRAQRQEASWLASERLAELENARAHLVIVTATAQHQKASFVAPNDEIKKLCQGLAQLTVETGTFTSV